MTHPVLTAQSSQLALSDEGQILFQEKVGSPLPGAPIARLVKGESILAPKIVAEGLDDAALGAVQVWFDAYVKTVLEPLLGLQDEALDGAPKAIAAAVFAAFGTVPRADVQDNIAQLDETLRATIRAKKMRLGPLFVFQPELNKPAPIRLRSVLWSLFYDKPMPAAVPKDGVVSYAIEEGCDADYFNMIGYPVYGGRAIRIDMLDRVVNAVYEGADKGKFKAEHKMAEWLGSTIEDLYKVLEALGHKKIYDPADEVQSEEETTAAEAPAAELKVEESSEYAKPTAQASPQEKPELATFVLKRGKANQSGDARTAKAKSGAKFKKDKAPKKGKRNKSTNKQPKVMSAEAKVQDDNPFAVLEQLKKNG